MIFKNILIPKLKTQKNQFFIYVLLDSILARIAFWKHWIIQVIYKYRKQKHKQTRKQTKQKIDLFQHYCFHKTQ